MAMVELGGVGGEAISKTLIAGPVALGVFLFARIEKKKRSRSQCSRSATSTKEVTKSATNRITVATPMTVSTSTKVC